MNLDNLADNSAAVNSSLVMDKFFKGANFALAAIIIETPNDTV